MTTREGICKKIFPFKPYWSQSWAKKKNHTISNIERLAATEENCGITIEGANAIYDGPYLDGNMHAVVNAEIHAVGGTKVEENVDNFFVLTPLKLHLSVKEKPARIRIYAQKGDAQII